MPTYTKSRYHHYTAFLKRNREDVLYLILKALSETTRPLTISYLNYQIKSCSGVVKPHIEHLLSVGCIYNIASRYYITDKGRAALLMLAELREMLGCGRDLRIMVYAK